MVKFIKEDTSVVFSEIPDEITLCLNITNCPHHCPRCHSAYLRQDIGDELTWEVLEDLIKKNDGISCVCFMGEGKDPETLIEYAKLIRKKYGLKVAIYTGLDYIPHDWEIFDYVKIGPYDEARGPINVRTTNQRLIAFNHPKPGTICSSWYSMDLTDKFWN